MSETLEQIFPDFSNFREIGRGGSATVFLAFHTKLGIPIAIKSISKFNLSLNEKMDKNFKNELNILKNADFPFICHFFQLIENDDFFYIAMEYAVNGTLLQLLNLKGKLDINFTKKIITQIAATISYLHNDLNVIHRDIKIENIMFDQNMNVRLIDFGLSKVLKKSECICHTLCGSYPYAAPEIFRRVPYSKPIDVWSLGIVLFSMIVGKFPFEANSMPQLVRKIINEDPEYPEDMDRGLKDLLQKMLNKDPKKRITIDEVLQHSWLSSLDNINTKSDSDIFQNGTQNSFSRFSDMNYLKSKDFQVTPTPEYGLDTHVAMEIKNIGYDPMNSIKEKSKEYLLYRVLRKERVTEIIENPKIYYPSNPLTKKMSAPAVIDESNETIELYRIKHRSFNTFSPKSSLSPQLSNIQTNPNIISPKICNPSYSSKKNIKEISQIYRPRKLVRRNMSFV